MVEAYDRNFSNLRGDVSRFQEFAELDGGHYVSHGERAESRLTNNLLGTEVDVVLETLKHLFIGEVKHESTFGANGKLMLVHQLVRQYVTATILLQIAAGRKEVIPFGVGDSTDYLKKTSQVRSMTTQGWLSEANVLAWGIRETGPGVLIVLIYRLAYLKRPPRGQEIRRDHEWQ